MKSNYTQNNYRYLLTTLAVVVVDQLLKLWVHTQMIKGSAGEIHLLGDFFKLHYLTNPGMAFGLDVGGPYGKWFLTMSRILVMGGLSYYLFHIIRKGHDKGFVICISAILGGAIGNVIDSTFYGVWLANAPLGSPTPWFHGQVIDMFYIDIWAGFIPDYIPLLGGMHVFLWPIFNIADASIFLSVLYIFIYQRRFADTLTETESKLTELPSSSTDEGAHELPSSSTDEGAHELPSSSTDEGAHELPSSSTDEGAHELPSSSTDEGAHELPSSSTDEGAHELPSSSTDEGVHELPSSSTDEGVHELLHLPVRHTLQTKKPMTRQVRYLKHRPINTKFFFRLKEKLLHLPARHTP